MWWLLAACASSACFTIVAFSTFVPLQHDGVIEYLFVAPRSSVFTFAAAAGLLVPIAAFFGVQRLADHDSPSAAEARTGRWLAPIVGLSVVCLRILPALPGVGMYGAVAAYFIYGLRWWWAVLLGGWAAILADRCLGEPVVGRLRSVATWSDAARL